MHRNEIRVRIGYENKLISCPKKTKMCTRNDGDEIIRWQKFLFFFSQYILVTFYPSVFFVFFFSYYSNALVFVRILFNLQRTIFCWFYVRESVAKYISEKSSDLVSYKKKINRQSCREELNLYARVCQVNETSEQKTANSLLHREEMKSYKVQCSPNFSWFIVDTYRVSKKRKNEEV